MKWSPFGRPGCRGIERRSVSWADQPDAPGFAGPDDGGARPVAEEEAGPPILPVDDRGELLGADHEGLLVAPRGDHGAGGVQA
jgi:sugar lactone lactonase YvrE